MSADKKTTYLVTGASRGIGKGLVTSYLFRSNVLVIAAVRDSKSTASQALYSLPAGPGSSIIVVQIDSSSEVDARGAVESLQSNHNVTALDVVIANAGIFKNHGPVQGVKPEVLREHFEVNAMGPLILFQATLPLLEASTAQQPKFVLLGSSLGSIAGMEQRPAPFGAYGASKAMAHYLVRKIHSEHENLTAFAADPGFVQTDTGNEGARFLGMQEAPMLITSSVEYLIQTIDAATREKTSGRFPSIAGGEFAW